MSDLQVFPSMKEKPKYRKFDCENGLMQFRDVNVSRFSSCASSMLRVEWSCLLDVRI